MPSPEKGHLSNKFQQYGDTLLKTATNGKFIVAWLVADLVFPPAIAVLPTMAITGFALSEIGDRIEAKNNPPSPDR